MNTQIFGGRGRVGLKIGVVTALVTCAGCTAAQGGEPGTSGAPTTPVITSDIVTVTIEGTTKASDGSSLAGVSVCLRTDPTTAAGATCTTSDDNGAWKIASVPSNAWVAVTFIKDGFFPTLRPINTDTTDIQIPPTDGALIPSTAMATMLKSPVDSAAGHVVFATATPGHQASTPATVAIGLIGQTTTAPVYFDTNGDPVPGANAGATGAFANLAPGYYEATFAADGVDCSDVGGTYGYPITAYASGGLARLMVPVVEGFLTAPVAVSCTTRAAQ
jgi:hypothetical protein